MSAYDRLDMRILVIGGSQLSGPFMVRQLIERGHDVTLYNRGNRPWVRHTSSRRGSLGRRRIGITSSPTLKHFDERGQTSWFT